MLAARTLYQLTVPNLLEIMIDCDFVPFWQTLHHRHLRWASISNGSLQCLQAVTVLSCSRLCHCARPRAEQSTALDSHSLLTLHTAAAAEDAAQVRVVQHLPKGTVLGPSS